MTTDEPTNRAGQFAEALNDWAEFWHRNIGKLSAPAQFDQNLSRFESEITRIRFRGLAQVPILIFGNVSPDVRRSLLPFIANAPAHSLGIIVCLTPSAFDFVQNSPALPPARFVVLCPESADRLRDSSDPVDTLRQRFLDSIPFHRLIPYTISEPTEGNMFVGREHELQTLMYEDQDYALAGRGGVGKTSILREMQRRLRIQRDPRAKRLVEEDWLTCPQDLDMAANMLARRIINSKHAQTVNCENLAAFMRRTRLSDPRFADGPIDLIIDEVDEILALDRRTIVKGARYPLMRQLRHARLQGSIRLTISGRDETETLLNDSRNPFALGGKDSNQGDYTRFKLLQIGALSDEAARELLLKPLRDLEYPVDAEAKALEKKLKNTRGIPVSIQSAGLDLANEAARKRVRTDSTV